MPTFDLKAALARRKACWYFVHGQCQFTAETCAHGRHEPRLDPKLAEGERAEKFEFSTEKGQSCTPCLQRNRECDKLSRTEALNDPCSECRHFGGVCQLARDTSHNEIQFTTMLNSPDFTLAEPPNRREPGRKTVRVSKGGAGKPAVYKDVLQHQPLAAEKVKPDWEGESRDALLNKEYMVPEAVRKNPRAYLKTPGLTLGEKKNIEYKRNNPGAERAKETGQSSQSGSGKRKKPAEEPTAPSPISTKHVEYPCERVVPTADPVKGRPMNVAWNYEAIPNTMTVTWEFGEPEKLALMMPTQPVAATTLIPSRPKDDQDGHGAKRQRLEPSNQSESAGPSSVASGQLSTATTEVDNHRQDNAATEQPSTAATKTDNQIQGTTAEAEDTEDMDISLYEGGAPSTEDALEAGSDFDWDAADD